MAGVYYRAPWAWAAGANGHAGDCVVLFLPGAGAGSLFGTEVRGFVSPIGISVLVGAFIFGVGMQLGGGCASGTLFTAGGGNARMLITLVFFIVGSVIGTAHFAWWQSLPAFQPVSLVNVAGVGGGIGISLVLFAAIAVFTVIMEKRRHGHLEQAPMVDKPGAERWLSGPWPLVAGAVALALLNFATLALAGRPGASPRRLRCGGPRVLSWWVAM